MRLDSVFPFLPTGFTLHFVGSMIACASIFFISRFFSPLLVPQYNNLSPSQKLLWCTSGVRLYGNFMVYLFISKEVPRWVDYFVNAGFGPYDDLLYMESSKVFAHALGISLGYMAFDLILQMIQYNGIIKNILGALFVASFTVIRIIPIPLVAWVLFTASYDKMLFSEKVAAAATVPIPIFMNIYCYSLMLRVARDRLKGLTTTTNAKKKA